MTLAAPIKGRCVSCTDAIANALMAPALMQAAPTRVEPTWHSSKLPLTAISAQPTPQHRPHDQDKFANSIWLGPPVTASAYDESILTTPWMCAENDMPQEPHSLGIVYDMVPNLLALGILRLPSFINVYRFAHQHSLGYDFYLRHARRVSCISESTRRDFVGMYSQAIAHNTEVCIPFDDFGNGEVTRPEQATDVLLINVLDLRKNFAIVCETLKQAAQRTALRVTVIGQERIALSEVMRFLADIACVCTEVRWYRSPSDAELELLMKTARVLFFPSIYEGLGLPILEAQAKGIPVISSKTSSCLEINLNPQLTADPYDHQSFTAQLVGLVNNTMPVLAGSALRERQNQFLQDRNRMVF